MKKDFPWLCRSCHRWSEGSWTTFPWKEWAAVRPLTTLEELVESQQRAEIIGETIVKAWNHIVETPDELLVNLIAETTERICGFKPEPELVEQFLSRHVRALSGASPPAEEPPRGVLHTPTQVGGQRAHQDWPGLHPTDHPGTGGFQSFPGCSATD